MSKDLTPIVQGWDHEPDELQVRIVPGLDGRDKLQMRIELGLIQMELDGRPDGKRPHGQPSLLDYHEQRAGDAKDYLLSAGELAELMREGVQFYHRYISLFHLELYDRVSRDTIRNLQLFRFVREHAPDAEAAFEFDRYRPYVIMMHTRAEALQAVARGDHRSAIDWVDRGLAQLREFLGDYPRIEADDCQELSFLESWREQLAAGYRPGARERLEALLADAVTREDYEQAARLRDRLRLFDKHPTPPPAEPPLDSPM